jgi:hypothetical protein
MKDRRMFVLMVLRCIPCGLHLNVLFSYASTFPLVLFAIKSAQTRKQMLMELDMAVTYKLTSDTTVSLYLI